MPPRPLPLPLQETFDKVLFIETNESGRQQLLQVRVGFGVWGLGFGVWGLGFGVWGYWVVGFWLMC